MKMIDLYDGFMVLEIHWTEARYVVEALKGYEPDETRNGEGEHVNSLATAFEAGTYAGRLQVRAESIAQDVIPLSRFRRAHGLGDDSPHGFELARDRKERREARQAAREATEQLTDDDGANEYSAFTDATGIATQPLAGR